MIHRIPAFAVRTVATSFAVWVLLSTVIPQTILKYSDTQIQNARFVHPAYPYNSLTSPLPLPIQNASVYFVIGHPDDEVMFFAPTLVELAKPKYNNRVHVVCFSRGDAVHESMGRVRSTELAASARILGVDASDVHVLDSYADGMDVHWNADDIADSLADVVSRAPDTAPVLVTFDSYGVSSHPNHISLYHGCKRFFEKVVRAHDASAARLYVLKSLHFWEKYSFTLLSNIELLADFVLRVVRNVLNININISFFDSFAHKQLPCIKVYSDLNMLSVSYAAMAYGHFSQMVWFRYGWLILSRYLTFNHLTQIY